MTEALNAAGRSVKRPAFKQCSVPAFDEYVMQLDTEPFNIAISQTSNCIRVYQLHHILLSVKHDGFTFQRLSLYRYKVLAYL